MEYRHVESIDINSGQEKNATIWLIQLSRLNERTVFELGCICKQNGKYVFMPKNEYIHMHLCAWDEDEH